MFVDGKILTAPVKDRVSPGPLGVRMCDRSKCFDGYTLFSLARGNTEYLIDLNGMVVHTWPVTGSQFAELRPDGHLLVGRVAGKQSGGRGLDELLPDGERVWHWNGHYHHDFEVLPNDNIICLTRRNEPPREGFYPPDLEPPQMCADVVVEIDRSGSVIWEFSFNDHIAEVCDLTGLPQPVRYEVLAPDGTFKPRIQSDWAHTNTIEVLPDTPLGRRDARFRAGNLLFSFRALDIIGIIDRDREEIVWAWGLGILDGQHHPSMLPDGHILIFDNGTCRGYSAVVEMDPESGEVVWRYEDGDNFFSPYRSGAQRLPNGNTLICECEAGRIFEVTAEKEIVWDYYSPFLGQGPENEGRHIYRATRYTEAEVEPLFVSRTEKIIAVADSERKRLTSFREVLKFYQAGFRKK